MKPLMKTLIFGLLSCLLAPLLMAQPQDTSLTSDGYSDSLTQEDFLILEVVDSLQSAVFEGNKKKYDSLFDFDYFFDEYAYRNDAKPELFFFNVGYSNELNRVGMTMFETIAKTVDLGGYYDFMHFTPYPEDSVAYVLFRLIDVNLALNYHEYYLFKDSTGQYKIGDVYLYSTGEYLSETFGRLYYLDVNQFIQSGYLSQSEELLLEYLPKVAEMGTASAAGDTAMALSIYRELPPEVQTQQSVQLMAIMATPLDHPMYGRLLENFLQDHPGDPSFFLLGIDYYYLQNDWEQLYDCLDSLYTYTNDPFLTFQKGIFKYEEGKVEESLATIELAMEGLPLFSEGYDYWLHVLSEGNQFERCIQVLEKVMAAFEVDKKIITDVIQVDYPALYESEAFRQWMKKP